MLYAIGDIQGCFDEFMALLSLIQFDESVDQLLLTGDLVNRGEQSLEVLRYVKRLCEKKSAITVLGNHDFHCMAMLMGVQSSTAEDTLTSILNAPDREELFHWLRHQPLVHYDESLHVLLVHAGVLPDWTVAMVLQLAKEVEKELSGNQYKNFLQHIYGDFPNVWSDDLRGYDRLRFVVNCFTRMRYMDEKTQTLDFSYKGSAHHQLENKKPWFSFPSKTLSNSKVIFGHWAALLGKTSVAHAIALDTGCCWGNALTAIRLADLEYFNVNCSKYSKTI